MRDNDNDGVADFIDLDSDNDGLTDVFEAGGSDVELDGVVDGFIDVNADGHDDNTAMSPLAEPDTDADGVVDYLDLDSDNDGLHDTLECAGVVIDADGVVDDLTILTTMGLRTT